MHTEPDTRRAASDRVRTPDTCREPVVSVCICTFRRPHVAQTIQSVLSQRVPRDLTFEIVVCDDDPDEGARGIVQELSSLAPCVLRYVVSGSRNVAIARNTCLAAAHGKWVAFIDDDEIADLHWLESLVRAQRLHGADVVKGFVRGVYPQSTPGWLKAADPFTRDYGPTGSRMNVCASGNVLFRRALVTLAGMSFDPDLGQSGGEDSDFFRRAFRLGAKIISCREAIVNEIVPPYRVRLDYLNDKSCRIGETAGRAIRQGTAARREAILEAARAVAGVVLAWTYPALRPFNGAIAYRLMVKFWFSIGLLRGLAGTSVRQMA